MPKLPWWFAALIATMLLSGSFVACGGDDSVPDGATIPTLGGSATPVVTKAPIAADAPQTQEVLAMDGLREFVAKFAAAVEAKDAQFFIDNAYFQTPDCPAFGQPPGTPHFCFGIGAPPTGPAIFLGVWNSEGAIVSQDYYETRVRENLDLERASLYALGQQKNGLEIGSSEVGIVVSFAPKEQSTTPASPPPATSSPTPTTPNSPLPTTETSPSPTIPTPRSPSISAFRLDRTNGEWRIVGIDAGSVNLVPDFFDWYTLWDDAFVTP